MSEHALRRAIAAAAAVEGYLPRDGDHDARARSIVRVAWNEAHSAILVDWPDVSAAVDVVEVVRLMRLREKVQGD